MHDLSFFRNNFDGIAERLSARSNAPNLEQFRALGALTVFDQGDRLEIDDRVFRHHIIDRLMARVFQLKPTR